MVDGDGTDCRFVEFHLRVGGESLRRGCGPSGRADGLVVLQFSTDAGQAHQITHKRKRVQRHAGYRSPN